MDYVKPFGVTTPGRPSYVNGNPAAGVMGSIPDVAVWENPMRELLAIIEATGIIPSSADLQQALRAIRGGKLEYYIDGAPFSGNAAPAPVAGAPAILPNPAHTSLFEGLHVRVKMGSPCTGPTPLAVSGLSAPIRRRGGVELIGKEWATGDVLDFVMAGGVWQICGLVLSDLTTPAAATILKTVVNQRTLLFSSRTAGTYTTTVPASVTRIFVPGLWGSGGGGGYNSNSGAPSGGATGGFCPKPFGIAVNPGDTITIVIGAGGLGGAASPARAGQPGGTTTLAINGTIILTANGGNGGLNGASSGQIANAPLGGTVSGGDPTFFQPGATGLIGQIANGGAILGGYGAGAPSGGPSVPGGQGGVNNGSSPGGGGGSSGNPGIAGATGADGGCDIYY